MALPLPNLDTRRWEDLVDEARTLVPRLAPSWSDHNVHDPGITVLELLAWHLELELYRANRITERHRRAFLDLTGHPPRPPRPARLAVALTPQRGAAAVTLPAGTALAARPRPGDAAVPFALTRALTPLDARLAAVQVAGPDGVRDLTPPWRAGQPLPLLTEPAPGADPDRAPALVLGLDRPLAAGTELCLWVGVEAGEDPDDRWDDIRADAEARRQDCHPAQPRPRCVDPDADPGWEVGGPAHHDLVLEWEARVDGGWRPLEAADATRALTLDGIVRLTPDRDLPLAAWGAVAAPLAYVRCRLVRGTPDAAVVVRALAVNAVVVAQQRPARAVLTVAPGTAPRPADPQPGQRQRLDLDLDADGVVTGIGVDDHDDAPALLVLGYQPPTAASPGQLTVAAAVLGRAAGVPGERFVLPDAPVADGAARVWAREDDGWRPWTVTPSGERRPRRLTLDAAAGTLTAGDGWRARVPPPATPLLAAYGATLGAAGAVPAAAQWRLDGADDAVNRALLGGSPAAVAANVEAIAAVGVAAAGRDAESLAAAAARAAADLWAHERLVELAPLPDASLDQLDPDAVLARPAPRRAATLRDVERVARAVPGTRVRRARAFAGRPGDPCRHTSGHVTCVIVPEFPSGAPTPSPGLRAAVQGALDRRRTIGTGITVVGPEYVDVGVHARLRITGRRDGELIRADAREALTRLLDPLRGGPDARGWPFGRDLHRSEPMAALAGIRGVDHVAGLTLSRRGVADDCGSVCLGPAQLPRLVDVRLEVEP